MKQNCADVAASMHWIQFSLQARALQHQPPLLSLGYGLEGQRPGLSRSAAIFQGLVVVALHQNFSERQNEAENVP